MAQQAQPPSPAAIASAVASDGYCVLPGLLTPAEVAGIRTMLEDGDGSRKYAYRGTTKMASFPQPGDDVLGRLARSRRLHAVAEAAIAGVGSVPGQGNEEEVGVQLHHVQATFKEAHSDYAFAWHQDYGYHYSGNILRPQMCTLVVAIDPCLPENGGLEILARSHACGRLDHRPKDSATRQLTADPDRMAMLLRLPHQFPLCPLSLQPGDAVVFHCLTLHRSGPNQSGKRRYALNITYNRRDNLPVNVDALADLDGGRVPPPLPYAVVEEDAAVAAGGVQFDVKAWGVPPIPRRIHEALERWRDGELEGLGPGRVEEGCDTEDEEDPDFDPHAKPRKRQELVFWSLTQEEEEAIAFKCRALKLRCRKEEDSFLVFSPEQAGGAATKRPRV